MNRHLFIESCKVLACVMGLLKCVFACFSIALLQGHKKKKVFHVNRRGNMVLPYASKPLANTIQLGINLNSKGKIFMNHSRNITRIDRLGDQENATIIPSLSQKASNIGRRVVCNTETGVSIQCSLPFSLALYFAMCSICLFLI